LYFGSCLAKIAAEIGRANFLAVTSDDTTDVSEKTQVVVTFRYDSGGTVHERFGGFYNPSSQDAEGLSQYVVLKGDFGKLIAQTYDGTAVMSGEKGGVQTMIKETYKNAYFIHCYAHQLNLMMEKAASQNPEVCIFVSIQSGIPTFFSRSPQRLCVPDCLCKRVPQGSNTRRNFNSRVINTVYENINELKECFKELQKSKNIPTVQAVSGLICMLNDRHFQFLAFFLSSNVSCHMSTCYMISFKATMLTLRLSIKRQEISIMQFLLSGMKSP
jgi:hypothetical protein